MSRTFFPTLASFRQWLQKHHGKATELWVGYYKKDSGEPSITWPESVDEALCFGWIDGIRKSIDDKSYEIRFTPRRTGSIWSSVNIKRVQVLIEAGRMKPAGLKAFEARRENKSGIYAYEQRSVDLPEPYAGLLKKNKKAWEFFRAQPAYYRKLMCWRIVSAKKEETRLKRLAALVGYCARGERMTLMKPARAKDG